MAEVSEGSAIWAIPWPCLHEFYAVVTNPRVFRPPSTVDQACRQIDGWLESPGVQLLTETDVHWSTLKDTVLQADLKGPRVHDARIAALCIQHGVRELWSADRDFTRFPKLKVVNPLIDV